MTRRNDKPKNRIINAKPPDATDKQRDDQDGNTTIAVFSTKEEAEDAICLLNMESGDMQ